MRFSEWMEARLPHVNKVGGYIANDVSLVKGPKAWNQQEQNCYAVAGRVAREFGYEPPSADEIRSVADQYKRYWASQHISWMKAPAPRPPKEGIANFIVRMGEEMMMHVSFEYRGKEYNYGAATPEGYEVVFKMGLKPLRPVV
jgi:hypothetical protein